MGKIENKRIHIYLSMCHTQGDKGREVRTFSCNDILCIFF